MNRILLEQMLKKMKELLAEGKSIGDLKIGALYALGNQLEAIFYFIGHELGSTLDEDFENKPMTEIIIQLSKKYSLGEALIIENNEEHITFGLKHCSSCRYIDVPEVTVPQGFCSFEAGLFAGVMEKMTGKHCFAQELECRLQGKSDMCKFMLVMP
ncbi:MAG: V4R domain-containing protein [Promethearchaeota archaeon]